MVSMSIPDTLSIGPLTVPTSLIFAVAVFAAAYLAGSLFLRSGADDRKTFNTLVSSPLIPFLLVWKLSPLATDTADVFRHPGVLIYGSGSSVNIAFGLVAAAAWTGFRWRKAGPPGAVNAAMMRSLVAAAVLSAALFSAEKIAEARQPHMRPPPVVLENPDGGTWTAEEAAGSPLVLNIWASWCPPCRAEMPMLASVAADPRYEDVVFYAVNAAVTEKSADAGPAWLQENGIEIPQLVDPNGEALAAYGIEGFPTTIVLDGSGYVAARKTGAVSRSWIVSAVRKARRTTKES